MVDFCDLFAKISTIGVVGYMTVLCSPYSLIALPFALPSMMKDLEEGLWNREYRAETVAQDDDEKVAEALEDVKET